MTIVSNLAHLPHVTVVQRSGAEGEIPDSNAIYVTAAATGPLDRSLRSHRPLLHSRRHGNDRVVQFITA